MQVAALPIDGLDGKAMFSAFRTMFPKMFRATCLAILPLALAFSPGALAQSAIDDVHITPRARSVAMVSAGIAMPNSMGGLAAGSMIHTSVELVMVPVSITDNFNRPIIGLDQENFEVFENKKPQEIKHFSSEDAPVSVGVVVDTSGSMGDKLERARDAVKEFCDASNPQDEFFMITFADTPRLATDFTTRSDDLQNDLLTARSKGRTALLDAIYMGVQKMRGARYARRALLIISDGGDNHSRYSEHDVKAAIKEADVTIYAVGTYDSYFSTAEEALGPELLRSVAELTGGRSFTLTGANDLPMVTRVIGTQLRHRYMLAYQPQSRLRDGKWHKISVKLRLPKKLHNYIMRVEARTGYYAMNSQ
jgi:Ca-activated chloride channel homolog